MASSPHQTLSSLSRDGKCRDCKISSNEVYNLYCSHEFCKKCLRKTWKKQIKNNEQSIHCPVSECQRPVAPFIFEGVLSEKYLKHLKTRECMTCDKSYFPIKFECGHPYCVACLKKEIKSKLKKNYKASCSMLNCTHVFTEENLKEIGLSNKLIKKFKDIPESMGKSQIKSEIRSITKDEREDPIKMEDEDLNEKRRKDILKGKIQCEICLDYFHEEEFLILTCNHRFCKSCLLNDWKQKILTGYPIVCPNENCTKEINYYLIKDNLPQEEFNKYDEKLCLKSLNEPRLTEKTINCPSKCNVSCLIWKDASYFTCPTCKKTFCSNQNCLGEWRLHDKLTCQEYKKMYNKQGFYDESEFEKYCKDKKLMKCPKCNAMIEKTKNCNFIRCESQICEKKTVFCYLCGEQLKERKINEHFIQNSPYNNCHKFEEKKQIEAQIPKEYNSKQETPKKLNNITEKRNGEQIRKSDLKNEKSKEEIIERIDNKNEKKIIGNGERLKKNELILEIKEEKQKIDLKPKGVCHTSNEEEKCQIEINFNNKEKRKEKTIDSRNNDFNDLKGTFPNEIPNEKLTNNDQKKFQPISSYRPNKLNEISNDSYLKENFISKSKVYLRQNSPLTWTLNNNSFEKSSIKSNIQNKKVNISQDDISDDELITSKTENLKTTFLDSRKNNLTTSKPLNPESKHKGDLEKSKNKGGKCMHPYRELKKETTVLFL